MRSSPMSLAAESVFQYDLQHELEVDLDRLRKRACDDGDIVFILSNQTSIWAHSPLFYVAANNRLPTEFGTEAGTAINDRGITVNMLFVPEDKRPGFEEVMNICYTIENLSLLWKAIGGDEVRFGLDREHQHMEMDTSRVASALPTAMLPDFEIHLREIGRESIDEPSGFSLKVHRFILDARITYYQLKTHAGLKLKDFTPMASNLSRMVFTEFSLWSIAMYVYCGIPSIIFSLDPNLQDYIEEPVIRDSRLKKNSHCNEFRTEERLPAEGIEYGLLEIARAANFLLAPQLDNWAHFQLYRLAHRFQCAGNGCAEIIPCIIDAIHQSDITDEWLFNTGISWLTQYENIHHLWKWPLLYKSKVIPLIVEKIIETDWENTLDEEKKPKRGKDAIELFVRLWKLKQYILMTKDSDQWNSELIEPLMEHAAEVVVEDLSNSLTLDSLDSLLDGLSFSKLAGEELMARIINKACIRGNRMKDWSTVEKLLELCENRETAQPAEEVQAGGSNLGMGKPPKITEEKLVLQKGELPAHKGNLGEDWRLDGREEIMVDLVPHLDQINITHQGGNGDRKKKITDTCLRGSAAPFIPSGRSVILGELSNNISSTSYSQEFPDISHNHSENQKYLQENHKMLKSQDARCLSRSDKSSQEKTVQTKRRGLKKRRMMSTPEVQTNEADKIRAESLRSGNRSYTNPAIGEAVPFRQQISKFYRARA